MTARKRTAPDFGLKPKKAATPLALDQKADAAKKRDATRAARHTMGSKQKQKVKGTITTIVTPPAAAAPTPTAPSPIANAPTPAVAGASAAAAPHAS